MLNASPTPLIVTDGDLAANVASYARHLRAANLSPTTQRAYLGALRLLATFLHERGMPSDVASIRREHLEAFIEDQLARLRPASAANRYASLRPFFACEIGEPAGGVAARGGSVDGVVVLPRRRGR